MTDLASRYGKTPAQVVLRWHVDQGLCAIPKSVRPHRIAENVGIFDLRLSPDDIAALAALETGVRGGPDPETIDRELFPHVVDTTEDGGGDMSWTSDELGRIGHAEELDLASLRSDGTARRPVTMWVVRAGNDIDVRSVNGRGSSWFRGVQDRHEAHVRARGVEKNVSLVEANDAADDVDAAYEAKYGGRYPSIVPSIVAPEARAATLRLVPRGD